MRRFFEKIRRPKKEITIEMEKEVPEDYWFEIGKELYEKLGKVPDPLQIRAQSIISAFRIPSFSYSSIGRKEKRGKEEKEKQKQKQREKERERDKIIAEYLTNRPGVWIDKEKGIISSDFRDLYPRGLPEELKEVLSPDTLEIMEIEYKHLKGIDPDTEDEYEADCPIHYFRLPGGIDLFMKGYVHGKLWQERHGEYLKKMNKKAKVICIEGFPKIPFGKSLEFLWNALDFHGHYDELMKEAVDEGFGGLFTEIDPRDMSKIRMDHSASFSFPDDLSGAFFSEFFKFLETQHPKFAEEIGTAEKLKKYLVALSTTADEGVIKREEIEGGIIFRNGKQYWSFPYQTKEGKTSFKPTLFELGQHLFTDALAAIKLHLIAKLMTEGRIKKGPIIDYEGVGHLSSKAFFLKHPEYAMEVVLRMINELMAGRVKKEGQIEQIYNVFRKPNWQEVVKEIAKLVFKKPSSNGKELLDEKIDFLETFNLDPEKIVPSDEEIEKIREKIRKSAAKKEKIENA